MCFASDWLGWGRWGWQPPQHTAVVSRPVASYVCWLHLHSLSRSDSISHCCRSKLPFCAVHLHWGSSKPTSLRPNRWFAPWRRRLMSVWSLANAGQGRRPETMARNDALLNWILSFGQTISAAPEKMNGSVTIGWSISENRFPLVSRFSAVTMCRVWAFQSCRAVYIFFSAVCPGTPLHQLLAHPPAGYLR